MRRRRKPMSLFPFHKHQKPLVDFEKGLDHFFDGFTGLLTDQMPKVNVKEEEDKYVVEAEMPGLDKDEIELKYEHGHLTIRGEQNQEAKQEQEGYISMERSQRKFQRTIPFDDENIDDDNISAQLDKGVLNITLPKKTPGYEDEGGKQIDIE